MDVEPDVAQPAGDVAVVGVDRLAGQDFIACAQYLDAHGSPSCYRVSRQPRQLQWAVSRAPTTRHDGGHDDVALHPPVVGAPSLALDNSALALDYDRISATRQFQAGKRLVADLAHQAGRARARCRLRHRPAGRAHRRPGRAGGPRARRRSAAAAHRPRPRQARGNLAFEVGDAYDLGGLPDSSFDVVVLNAVFHWLPEKTGAAARLLPGCCAAAGASASAPALKGHVTAAAADHPRSVLAEPPFDRLSAPAREHHLPRRRRGAARAVRDHRLRADPDRGAADRAGAITSAEAAIRFSEASSFGNAFGHLPEELKPLAREAVRRRLEAIITPEGIVQHGSRLVAIAERW